MAFLRIIVQDEGPEKGLVIRSNIADDVVAHVCAACSNSFTVSEHIAKELVSVLGIEMMPGRDHSGCEKCGKELRIGNSKLLIETVIAQIEIGKGKNKYIPIRAEGLLELCATCGTPVGVEEATAAVHKVIAMIGNGAGPAGRFEEDIDWRIDEETIREHTAPIDPEKLSKAGIVTRENLKGRFFRVDIDWGSSGIWETDEPCVVGGMGGELGYDEFELPEWLLNRFSFWEHWHDLAESHLDLPIDFDNESFSAYGRSLAVDLKYLLGPEISVCYREKEITLGPIFRNPVIKERPEPVLCVRENRNGAVGI